MSKKSNACGKSRKIQNTKPDKIEKKETNTKTETKRKHEERGLKKKDVALVTKFEN